MAIENLSKILNQINTARVNLDEKNVIKFNEKKDLYIEEVRAAKSFIEDAKGLIAIHDELAKQKFDPDFRYAYIADEVSHQVGFSKTSDGRTVIAVRGGGACGNNAIILDENGLFFYSYNITNYDKVAGGFVKSDKSKYFELENWLTNLNASDKFFDLNTPEKLMSEIRSVIARVDTLRLNFQSFKERYLNAVEHLIGD